MPRKLEKINLKSMILTLSLLSGLTLTSVNNLNPKEANEVQKQSRNPNVVEVIRKDESDEQEDELV